MNEKTLQDAGGSYSWIVESMDVSTDAPETYEQVAEWVNELIEQRIEVEIYDLDAKVEDLTFPLMGYTTAHMYEDVDQYIEEKSKEIEEELKAEFDAVFFFILDWATDPS